MSLVNIVRSSPISGASASQMEEFVRDHSFLANFGCKVYSQNGEDGIIYYILSKIGVLHHKCIEICGGDAIECNSANLMLNHGFHGLIFEANPEAVRKGIDYYQEQGRLDKLHFVQGWITRENIVDTLKGFADFLGDVDLFTMDMDGVDYWVLKEIMDAGIIRPRVIIVEYQDILGPERAWTVPYDPSFQYQKYDTWYGPNFCGASLQAFIQLLSKDYVFLGCEGLGFNGFFLHKSELGKGLAEMKDITRCFDIDKVQFGMQHRFPRTAHLPWVNLYDKSTKND